MKTKKERLDNLFYNIGKQQYNFELCCLDKEGAKSKWKKYLDVQSDKKFLEKANNRTILSCEVVIDLEDKQKFPEIFEKIKKDFEFFSAYETGSRGYHIHLFFNRDLTSMEKEFIIKKYKGDLQKLSNRCLIALENCPHWKTGNIKKLIEEKIGFNDLEIIKKEIDEQNEKLKQEQKAMIESEVLELLEGDEVVLKYIDLGEVNEEGYIGFNLNGKEAIITSAGKIYRNKTEKFGNRIIGENEIEKLFSYSGYIGDIAPTIAKETIKKFYTKTQRNHLINPKELYKTIRDKILYYMDFSGADEIADVLTCWVIATYFYPLFYWFPHILINAPSTSGKSKCGYIIIQMSFRGFDLGASAGVTPPQIFRTLEGNRGTILIDEFEVSKNKTIADTQQLVNQLLNASASRDAYVIRVEQVNGKWVAKKFPIYCPKVACNISGINPTSLSRYIAFSWLKAISEKSKRKPYKEKDKLSFIPIREELYLLFLENHKKIKEIYEKLDISLTAREEDNWLPLYAIANFIDDCEGENVNAKKQLDKYLENYKELSIETGDNTEDFFRILFEKVDDQKRYYTPKEIGAWVEIQDLYPYLKSPANVVGKNLKFYKFENNRGGGIRKYLLSKESVKKIIDLYFNRDIITPNITKDTQQHKQHITTQGEEEDVPLGEGCVVIKVGSVSDFSKEDIEKSGLDPALIEATIKEINPDKGEEQK